MKDWPAPPTDRVLARLRKAAGQTWRRYGNERRKWMNNIAPDRTALERARVAAEDAAMTVWRALRLKDLSDLSRGEYDGYMSQFGGREAEVYLKAVRE